MSNQADYPTRREAPIPDQSQSYWMASAPEPQYAPLSGDTAVDVAIVGAGIVGVTTAFLLKQAGLRVAIIESRDVLSGVTGRTTAKLTSLHGLIYHYLISYFGRERARMYAEANQAGIERIARWVSERHIDCDFVRTTAYTYSESEKDLDRLQREVKAAQALGLPASFVETSPLPFEIAGAVAFSNQARFHPRKYLLNLLQDIPGGGSQIYTRTCVQSVQDGAPCRVKTDRGTIEAGDVVIATNFPIDDRAGLYFTRLYPHRSYVLGYRIAGTAPEGMFYSTENPGHSYRVQPLDDGGMLGIVGGEDHKTGQSPNTPARYEALARYARNRFGAQTFEYRWSTQDNGTPDRVPYIGNLTTRSQHVFTATGFDGWGMTHGTVSGLILSDMIQGREHPWAALYNPSRFRPATSARTFLAENINVARQLIGGKLSKLIPTPPPSPVYKDQGEVVPLADGRAAIYKDEWGGIHAVCSVCAHMGCEVTWNGAEKSWDCPCHGSRYDFDGNVLHAPTTMGLAPEQVAETRPSDDGLM